MLALSVSFWNFSETSVEASETEGVQLELDFNTETYKQIQFEEEDGSIATLEIMKDLDAVPEPGSISTFALANNQVHTIKYSNGLVYMSYKIQIGTNPLRIKKAYDLQYRWTPGHVVNTSLTASGLSARGKLFIDQNILGIQSSYTRTLGSFLVQGRVVTNYN